MSGFGPRFGEDGSWWLTSKSDPRWNCEGHDWVGGGFMPEECRKKLAELEKKFGKQPKDLKWGYYKG